MLQMSKLIRSRDEWKRKAVERANEIRELRKTKKRYQDKIAFEAKVFFQKTFASKIESRNKYNSTSC